MADQVIFIGEGVQDIKNISEHGRKSNYFDEGVEDIKYCRT